MNLSNNCLSNIKQLKEKFYQLELINDLFNKKISGVHYWKLIRFNVFNYRAKELGLYEQAHQAQNLTFIEKVLSVPKKILNTYRYGWITRSSLVESLVFEHPRKIKINGAYQCIYTKELVSTFEREGKSYEVIDKEYLGLHLDKPNKKRSFAEQYSLIYFFQRFVKPFKLTESDKKQIEWLNNVLNNTFKVDVDLTVLIEKSIRDFLIKKYLYKKALQKRQVKTVYLVVYYGYESLISACKELGIKVVELQHGTMSHFHMAYSFPENVQIPYFPDEIQFFGKFWQESTPLPVNLKKATFIGYSYLEKQLDSYKHLSKRNNSVVFLSQGTIGRRLASFACEFAKQNSHLNIQFKLHPGEFGRWRENYTSLLEAEKLINFEVIENEKNLYELLTISKYAIGVYSTAIYEALACNCKVALVNLPGVEYCEYLYANNYVKLIETDELILEEYELDTLNSVDRNYFFKKVV